MTAKRTDPTISVAEVERRYPDEWVLMEITQDHPDTARVRGRVLAHSADRRNLDAAYELFRAARPEGRTFEFFTGELVPDGYVVVL